MALVIEPDAQGDLVWTFTCLDPNENETLELSALYSPDEGTTWEDPPWLVYETATSQVEGGTQGEITFRIPAASAPVGTHMIRLVASDGRLQGLATFHLTIPQPPAPPPTLDPLPDGAIIEVAFADQASAVRLKNLAAGDAALIADKNVDTGGIELSIKFDSAAQILFYGTGGVGHWRASKDGTNEVDTGIGLRIFHDNWEIDEQRGKIYFVELNFNTMTVDLVEQNYDGTGERIVAQIAPNQDVTVEALCLDDDTGCLYWRETADASGPGRIKRASLETGTVELICASVIDGEPADGGSGPFIGAVDSAEGYMWFYEVYEGNLYRVELATGMVTQVATGSAATGLWKDRVANKVLYAKTVGTSVHIMEAGFDGSAETLYHELPHSTDQSAEMSGFALIREPMA